MQKLRTIKPVIHECEDCKRIVSKHELEHNAQFGGYGFKKICNRCADYIDKQQDLQQGN